MLEKRDCGFSGKKYNTFAKIQLKDIVFLEQKLEIKANTFICDFWVSPW